MIKFKNLQVKNKSSGLIVTALGRLGLKIGAAGLGFLNGIITARLLGPREFGIYTLLMATTTLVATISVLGLPSLITRQLAAYAVHEQWEMGNAQGANQQEPAMDAFLFSFCYCCSCNSSKAWRIRG